MSFILSFSSNLSINSHVSFPKFVAVVVIPWNSLTFLTACTWSLTAFMLTLANAMDFWSSFSRFSSLARQLINNWIFLSMLFRMSAKETHSVFKQLNCDDFTKCTRRFVVRCQLGLLWHWFGRFRDPWLLVCHRCYRYRWSGWCCGRRGNQLLWGSNIPQFESDLAIHLF